MAFKKYFRNSNLSIPISKEDSDLKKWIRGTQRKDHAANLDSVTLITHRKLYYIWTGFKLQKIVVLRLKRRHKHIVSKLAIII